MALGGDAVRATVWALVQNVGGRALSFVVFILLARLLDADSFGTVALATSAMMVCLVLLEAGCAEALVQREHVTDDHINSVFWATLAISVVLAAAVCLVSGIVAGIFSVPLLAPILTMLALTLPFAAISNVLAAALRRDLQFRTLAIRTFAVNIVSAAVGIGMAIRGMGVWSLVGKIVTEYVVSVLVLWLATRWRPTLRISRESAREVAPFGLNFVCSRIAQLLSNTADKWIAGYFLGTHALGLYNTAQRVFSLPQDLLPAAASNVLMPTLSRLQADPERARRALLKTIGSVTLLGYPVFGMLVLLMPDLVLAVLGPAWSGAILPAQILCAGGVVFSVTYLMPSVWLSQGRASWHFRYTLANGIANVTGFMIGVWWGPAGLALAYVVRGVFFTFPLSVYLVHRASGCAPREVLGALGLSLRSAVAMVVVTVAAATLLPADIHTLARIVILLLAGMLSFVGALALFARGELRTLVDDFCSAFPSARRFFPALLQKGT